ncbi:MAG TPA: hypothetical protein ENI87_04455 [bacterium]|nr:hypothetical protein [bacterium]
MNHHDDPHVDPQGAPFDEIAAMRRFPSEREWLDLPLPAELRTADGEEAASMRDFADRVLQRLRDERACDAGLAELDRALPRELLQQFAPPPATASFVADTAARIAADRRQRWQRMLARYVAPEPSAAFVSRTLAALREPADGDRAEAKHTTPRGRAVEPGPRRGLTYGLLAAAAALLLWFALTGRRSPTLVERLADRAPVSLAWSEATTPMASILARIAADEEPHTLFDEPVDGLWLLAGGGDELR